MRRLRTLAGRVTGIAGAAWLVWAGRELPGQLGARPTGERRRRIARSPRFGADGRFHNLPGPRRPLHAVRETARWLFVDRDAQHPAHPIPVVAGPRPDERGERSTHGGTETTGNGRLHVTWLGHSTCLVELDGARLLTDPIWSERCSPSPAIGPRRLHDMPLLLDELPRCDAIVVSHDHYDHLDRRTVEGLSRTQEAPFVVPLGVGAHLERWGVPARRIVELDWGESATPSGTGIRLTATPAQHLSGRAVVTKRTLWASWVMTGPHHRAYFSGDTGYFGEFRRIGAEHGPFDVVLMQIGAYGDGWPNAHMTPEEAARALRDLGTRITVPIHWGTFSLAGHPWDEPVERLLAATSEDGMRVVVPRPGERVDVDAPPPLDPWWRAVAR